MWNQIRATLSLEPLSLEGLYWDTKKIIILKPGLIYFTFPNTTKYHPASLCVCVRVITLMSSQVCNIEDDFGLQLEISGCAWVVRWLPSAAWSGFPTQISTPLLPSALHIQVSCGSLNVCVYGGCQEEGAHLNPTIVWAHTWPHAARTGRHSWLPSCGLTSCLRSQSWYFPELPVCWNAFSSTCKAHICYSNRS